MGTSQELKARASVEALAQLQVPHARVRRSGRVEEVESTELVPGDVVLLEAGDVVPADGRILTSATLEVQEAALTGESAPVAKDRTTLPEGEIALGDRTNLVFQNTQVTRGSATVVVTATGAGDPDGPHRRHGHGDQAHAVAAAARARRHDQDLRPARLVGGRGHRHRRHRARPGHRDARAAVHLDRDLGDPDRPADVRADDAVVGGAAPRRVQGGREVAHRRRDARRHDGHQQRQDRHADDERDDRDDDARRRRLVQDRGRRLQEDRRDPRRGGRSGARLQPPRARAWSCAATPPSATTSRSSAIRPRRRSSCSPRRWASTPRRPGEALPRRAEVPFDSEYKFMATFHDRPGWLDRRGPAASRTS